MKWPSQLPCAVQEQYENDLHEVRWELGFAPMGSGFRVGGLGVIVGLYWGTIRVILGLDWDNGKENRNYYRGDIGITGFMGGMLPLWGILITRVMVFRIYVGPP